LQAAGKAMPGNWMMHFDGGNIDHTSVDATQYNDRPYEYRCSFSMEYIATKIESDAMQKKLTQRNKTMTKQQIIAGDRTNDPTLKNSIEVSIVVNPYQFAPVSVSQASTLGGVAFIPGTALTLYRTKDLGPGTPHYTLYIGEYKIVDRNGKGMLEETFTTSPDRS